jgi:hypothetical protein
MAEFPAPTDNDRVRINNLDNLQRRAGEVISQMLGSDFLANLVTEKPAHPGSIKLWGFEPTDGREYDGYMQIGLCSDGSEWLTEVTHHTKGESWEIKTFIGDNSKQNLYATFSTERGIRIDTKLSIENLRRIVLERALSGKISGAESETLLQGLGILFVKEKDLQKQRRDPQFQILTDALFTSDPKTSHITLHLPV